MSWLKTTRIISLLAGLILIYFQIYIFLFNTSPLVKISIILCASSPGASRCPSHSFGSCSCGGWGPCTAWNHLRHPAALSSSPLNWGRHRPAPGPDSSTTSFSGRMSKSDSLAGRDLRETRLRKTRIESTQALAQISQKVKIVTIKDIRALDVIGAVIHKIYSDIGTMLVTIFIH